MKSTKKLIILTVAVLGIAGVSLTTAVKQDFFEMSKQLEIMNSTFKDLVIE